MSESCPETLSRADVDAAVDVAVCRLMGEVPQNLRRDAVERLWHEVQRCLTEAPSTANPVADLGLRAQFAASFSRHLGAAGKAD